MKKAPIKKYLCLATWGITALFAANVGFSRFLNFDFFATDWAMMNPGPVNMVLSLVGLAGFASLVMYCMWIKDGCKDCK